MTDGTFWYKVGQTIQTLGDKRFRGEVKEVRHECSYSSHGPDCVRLLVEWHAGNIDWEHSLMLEPVGIPKADTQDKAYQVWANGAVSGTVFFSMTETLPYVVIGQFAYGLGWNGSLYSSPTGALQNGGLWREIDSADETDFPVGRLKNVLSDTWNVSDIMAQHGVKVR